MSAPKAYQYSAPFQVLGQGTTASTAFPVSGSLHVSGAAVSTFSGSKVIAQSGDACIGGFAIKNHLDTNGMVVIEPIDPSQVTIGSPVPGFVKIARTLTGYTVFLHIQGGNDSKADGTSR